MFALSLFCGSSGSTAPLARDPDEVSLISLIADPARYDDRSVVVVGFAIFDQEMSALFLRKDDAERFAEANSVPISTDWSQSKLAEFHGRYVRVRAKFSATSDRSRGYLHSLENVQLAPTLVKFEE